MITPPLLTEYHYDLASPGTYQSNNNRLEYYEVFDTSSGGQALLSTTWYYYTREWGTGYADIGNVMRIVTNPEASTQYSAVRFGYAMNDRTVSHAVGTPGPTMASRGPHQGGFAGVRPPWVATQPKDSLIIAGRFGTRLADSTLGAGRPRSAAFEDAGAGLQA